MDVYERRGQCRGQTPRHRAIASSDCRSVIRLPTTSRQLPSAGPTNCELRVDFATPCFRSLMSELELEIWEETFAENFGEKFHEKFTPAKFHIWTRFRGRSHRMRSGAERSSVETQRAVHTTCGYARIHNSRNTPQHCAHARTLTSGSAAQQCAV